MNKIKDIVILVGSASGSALALIRSIKNEVNCKAFALCTSVKAAEVLGASRYIHESVQINGDLEDSYIKNIQNWYAKQCFDGKPILYFNSDTACYYVDNNRQWFEDRFELCLPSSHIVKSFTQKGVAEVIAEQSGLDVPKTFILNNEIDIQAVAHDFTFPIILKPRATYLKNDINFKIKVIDNKEEFTTFANDVVSKGNSLLCQEFIPGGDDVSYYYLFYRSKHGQIIDNMGRKTMQSSPKGGIMLKGMSKYNKEFADISRKFLYNINYEGIGGIEFKKYNEKFYFIEMSTRLEGFYKIAEISNSPLSLLSYYDLSHNIEKRDALLNSKQNDGMMYMDFIPTLVTKVKSRKYISFIGDVFNAIFSPKTKLNVFSMSDPKPFFLTLKNLIVR